MNVALVPVKGKYRGIERALSSDDYPKKIKWKDETFSAFLETYFEIVEYTLSPSCEEQDDEIRKLIVFQKEFRKYGIDCEIIAYDVQPISSACDYSVEFLGIDLFDEFDEPILIDEPAAVNEVLNGNGLCKNENDAELVVRLLDTENEKVQRYYVYKVQVEKGYEK